MTWSDWKPHTQGPRPVGAQVLVIVRMGDGDVFSPMPAAGLDWDFAGDPVVAYKVQEYEQLEQIKRLVSLDASVNA